MVLQSIILIVSGDFSLPGATAPSWPGAHDHTHFALHTSYDSSIRVISPSHRPLPDNTQHSQETKTFMTLAGFDPATPTSPCL